MNVIMLGLSLKSYKLKYIHKKINNSSTLNHQRSTLYGTLRHAVRIFSEIPSPAHASVCAEMPVLIFRERVFHHRISSIGLVTTLRTAHLRPPRPEPGLRRARLGSPVQTARGSPLSVAVIPIHCPAGLQPEGRGRDGRGGEVHGRRRTDPATALYAARERQSRYYRPSRAPDVGR